jgi:hypothetical protein
MIIIFTLSLLCGSIGDVKAQDGVIQPGEELFYEVSFFGINLGSIKIITEGYQTFNGYRVIKAKSYIDSYSGIPFVDLHSIFETWMDQTVNFSHQFISNTKTKEGWLYEQLLFNFDKGNIHVSDFLNKKQTRDMTIYTKKRYADGLNLFFLARTRLNSKKNIKIPTMIESDTVTTVINFGGRKVNVDMDATDYPVKTIYFNGDANWTGIYGLTGKFEGWFSDDAACIPIKANMKVYVGSVDIELKSWKRQGWKPPRG